MRVQFFLTVISSGSNRFGCRVLLAVHFAWLVYQFGQPNCECWAKPNGQPRVVPILGPLHQLLRLTQSLA
jgi:hypothetical protein